ncbi:MAG TPA: SPOR domain-containing protein [Chiayiivirga sp.]|nr:SPOR domain-containing protein [Chiayiivirga sp.]
MLARALIALLLMMNLVVALWLWLRPTVATDAAAPMTDTTPSLVLLSEEASSVAGVPQAAEPDGPPEPTPGLDHLECLEIGPFLTQADLRRAMNSFSVGAERIQFRETRATANRGYWVFLPAQRSREEALARARELSGKGLRDYYVVTAGARENTVSLGLFQDRNNAQARFDEVRALGFDAQLQPRSDEIPNYWIDLAVVAGYDWPARLDGFIDVSGSPIRCE